ncbi:hypothetical protein GCM10027425_15290 [Alteromonas gracilis]
MVRGPTGPQHPTQEVAMTDPQPTDPRELPDDTGVIADDLVEEVSIDGMCGVY